MENGLYSHESHRGAEVMMQVIANDINHILTTVSVRPIHERVAKYMKRQDEQSM